MLALLDAVSVAEGGIGAQAFLCGHIVGEEFVHKMCEKIKVRSWLVVPLYRCSDGRSRRRAGGLFEQFGGCLQVDLGGGDVDMTEVGGERGQA